MSGYSENELVEWLKEGSRMFDWGMIAVMDRAKANRLLTQEYIRHFAEDSYLPPQSGEVDTDSKWKNTIANAVLDVPRLSFENSNLQNSKARLRMAMVSGNRVRLEKSGDWQIRRIDQYTPQLRPELVMDLNLSDVPGGVKEGGELFLDLKNCSDFSFGFSGSESEQRDMGAFFKNKFDELEESKRIFHLGCIQQGGNELLRPDHFYLRTQARDPQSKDGDGAVISFIRMEGDINGSFPPSSETFKYLIPNDSKKDYSAAVAVNGGRVALVQLTRSLQEVIEGARFENKYKGEPGRRKVVGAELVEGKLEVSGAGKKTIEFDGNLAGMFAEYFIGDIVCELGRNLAISILPEGRGIVVEGVLEGKVPFRFIRASVHSGDPEEAAFATVLLSSIVARLYFISALPYRYTFKSVYVFDDDSGNLESLSLEIIPEVEPELPPYDFPPPDQWPKPPEFPGFENFEEVIVFLGVAIARLYAQIFYDVSAAIHGADLSLSSFIEDALDKSFAVSAPVDQLIDETIKLNFHHAIVRDKTRLLRDVIAFGKVNPALTSFVVDDLEPVLVASSTKKFSTIPIREDVQWSVEPKGCGHVDPKTGVYTAPAVGDIDGPFVRARVIAKTKSAESSALVTVVRQGLMLNPLLVTAMPGDEVKLEAGVLGSAGELVWRFKNENPHGRFKDPDATSPEVFYVAGENDIAKAYLIDTVEIENTVTNETCTSVIVTKTTAMGLVIEIIDSDVEAGTLQLEASLNGTLLDVDWTLIYGPGSISEEEKGLYTIGDAHDESFAVIFAEGVFAGVLPLNGVIVVPLPLTSDNLALAALCKWSC
ncbi:hypothetical protein ACNFG0_18390 [Pseudomonas sp. NY15372]|uniref:hypothetical protein n=1 Tax=Pseudomonas sp. NY15372 TaxID=3400356 RepID=UPI003A853CEC